MDPDVQWKTSTAGFKKKKIQARGFLNWMEIRLMRVCGHALISQVNYTWVGVIRQLLSWGVNVCVAVCDTPGKRLIFQNHNNCRQNDLFTCSSR